MVTARQGHWCSSHFRSVPSARRCSCVVAAFVTQHKYIHCFRATLNGYIITKLRHFYCERVPLLRHVSYVPAPVQASLAQASVVQTSICSSQAFTKILTRHVHVIIGENRPRTNDQTVQKIFHTNKDRSNTLEHSTSSHFPIRFRPVWSKSHSDPDPYPTRFKRTLLEPEFNPTTRGMLQ